MGTFKSNAWIYGLIIIFLFDQIRLKAYTWQNKTSFQSKQVAIFQISTPFIVHHTYCIYTRKGYIECCSGNPPLCLIVYPHIVSSFFFSPSRLNAADIITTCSTVYAHTDSMKKKYIYPIHTNSRKLVINHRPNCSAPFLSSQMAICQLNTPLFRCTHTLVHPWWYSMHTCTIRPSAFLLSTYIHFLSLLPKSAQWAYILIAPKSNDLRVQQSIAIKSLMYRLDGCSGSRNCFVIIDTHSIH